MFWKTLTFIHSCIFYPKFIILPKTVLINAQYMFTNTWEFYDQLSMIYHHKCNFWTYRNTKSDEEVVLYFTEKFL